MKNNNKYLIAIIILIVGVSCQQNEGLVFLIKDNNNLPPYEFLEVIRKNHNGIIGIKAEKRNQQDFKLSGGIMLDKVPINEIQIAGQNFVLDTHTGRVPETNEENISGWFGQTVNIKLINNQSSRDSEGEIELYVPKVIEIEDTTPLGTPISPAYSLFWNADPDNNIGLHIKIEYDPIFNSAFLEDYPEILTYYINTEDDGQYSFTSNDLEIFPDGATLLIRGLRGNFEEVGFNGSDDDVLIYTYSDILYSKRLQK